MRMGVILPTTKLYGGVKRFLELGNRFIARGHSFCLFTPEGGTPGWFAFRGEARPISALNAVPLDALFITETEFLPDLLRAAVGRRVFYCVSPSQAERLASVIRSPGVEVYAASSGLCETIRRRYGRDPVRAIGAVDCDAFRPRRDREPSGEVVVLAYGRLHRRGKGTREVVGACEALHRKGLPIRLLLFDSPVDENARRLIREFTCDVPFEFVVDHPVAENYKIFERADVFVAAERKAGWSNTCAEAMASRVAVVATTAGTRDFLEDGVTGLVVWRNTWSIRRALRRLAEDPALRRRLAQAGYERIQPFTWDRLADVMLGELGNVRR